MIQLLKLLTIIGNEIKLNKLTFISHRVLGYIVITEYANIKNVKTSNIKHDTINFLKIIFIN